VFAVEIASLLYVARRGRLPRPPGFGNVDPAGRLSGQDMPRGEFAFAVIGDPQRGSAATLRWLCGELARKPLAFMVLLGDCVRQGTEGYHRLLRYKWTRQIRLPFPVFYVVGNHDIKESAFSLARFEQAYGPTNFSFDYGGCLFIGLRALDKPEYSLDDTLAFLSTTLAVRRHHARRVFVFMHIPVPLPLAAEFSGRRLPAPERFTALFDAYKVDYVFAGDYHGYVRVQSRDTVYLVSGGGGGLLKENPFGRFHHALVLRVKPDAVAELILSAEGKTSLADRARELAFAEIQPWLVRHWKAAAVVNAALIAALLWALRMLRIG
jgi:hypothetical protein